MSRSWSVYRIDSYAVLTFPEQYCELFSRVVTPRLTFQERIVQYQTGYDPGANRAVSVQTQLVPVYRYSDSGQLVFPVGYWPAVKELLTEHVEEVRSLVLPLPPSFRAEAFVPDFAHMMSVFGRTDSSFFRYRQDEALAAVIAACQTGVGGIIDAPTGIGKSFIISALVMALRHAKIDIVAPSVSTVRNLYRRLIALTPHLSQVGGGKRETPKRLTLYCADSLHHASHEPGEEADLVIFDEVHEAGADTAIEQLAQYRSAVKIGLTASYQYRFDNRDHLLEGLFGPRLFYMSYTEAAEHGLVVPIHVNWLVCGDGMAKVNSRMSMANRMRMLYWQNAERCAALAEVARTHLAAGDQVLVMVQTVEHAMFMKRFLPDWPVAYDKIDPKDYDQYVLQGWISRDTDPPMTRRQRAALMSAFESGELRGAIANSIWSTGVDFTQLGVLIRADGMASDIANIQIPGRVARIDQTTGKSSAIVYDCCDRSTVDAYRRSMKRRKMYQAMGWTESGWLDS